MRWTVALLVAALGCAMKASEERSEGLAVAVKVEPATLAAGEMANITVTVSNTSNDARRLQFTSSCVTTFEVVDGDGRVVARGAEMCAQVMTTRTIAAGGSFSDTHEWGRRALDLPQVGPGRYQVRGVLLATGDTIRSQPTPVSLP